MKTVKSSIETAMISFYKKMLHFFTFFILYPGDYYRLMEHCLFYNKSTDWNKYNL